MQSHVEIRSVSGIRLSRHHTRHILLGIAPEHRVQQDFQDFYFWRTVKALLALP